MIKVRIKVLSECESRNKLYVVKLIKECTELGLKEAKWMADDMFNCVGIVKDIELREPYLRKDGETFNPLKEIMKIKNYGDFQITGGVSWQRDSKMLSLGIGDIEDYARFMSECITYNDLDENKRILELIFNKLTKEDLVELVNQIKF